ncbi:hypothetical protein ACFFRR_001616 [Megaselia abdita]
MDETTLSTKAEHWLAEAVDAASSEMTTTQSPTVDQYMGTQLFTNEFSSFSRSQLTLAAVLTIIIMMVGIFGNLLTIVALVKCPKVRNVAAAFIISLCLADCIFCAFVLPFNAFRFIKGALEHKGILCRLIPLMQYGNIGVSLLCIAMITINRYVMIAHHSAYAKIYKNHWIGLMIAFCWLFAYGMQMPTFFKVWGAFGYDDKLGTCSIIADENGQSSKTALFVIAFVIPCLIIIGCYAKIFWVVHESEKRLRKHANKQNSIPNNLRPISAPADPSRISVTSSSFGELPSGTKPSKVKDQREAKAKRNEWRITKMVLAIFLSFIICYLPITIVKVADKNVQYPGFHMFGYIMLYMSACINPIIYVIMNKQYRQAYKTVLMCKASLLLPFTQGGNGSSQPQGEKWKDARCSYNHSRTMVSQVSSPDQPQSSFSSVTPQPITMQELTTQNTPKPPTNNNHLECPAFTNPNQNNSITVSPPVPTLPPPFSQRRDTPPRPSGNRLILAEEDVIVEEEEYQELPIVTMDNPKNSKDQNFSNGIPDSNKVYDKQFKFDNVKLTHSNK